jgi:hypothetical protein
MKICPSYYKNESFKLFDSNNCIIILKVEKYFIRMGKYNRKLLLNCIKEVND